MVSGACENLRIVPTVTLNRPDLYPASTSVGIYPAGAQVSGQPPGAAAIASGTTDSAGALSVTNAGLLSLTQYVAYALVNGEHRYARLRSTLDVMDYGRTVGTCTTSSGSASISSFSATSGAMAVGQRVVCANFPAGVYVVSGSGTAWVLSDKATASGTGVAIEGHGAQAAAVNLGATAVPQTQSTKWAAKVRQRRAIAGTS